MFDFLVGKESSLIGGLVRLADYNVPVMEKFKTIKKIIKHQNLNTELSFDNFDNIQVPKNLNSNIFMNIKDYFIYHRYLNLCIFNILVTTRIPKHRLGFPLPSLVDFRDELITMFMSTKQNYNSLNSCSEGILHDIILRTDLPKTYEYIDLVCQNYGVINQKNYMGKSILQIAVEANNFYAVRALLKHGANPNQTNNIGLSATDSALSLIVHNNKIKNSGFFDIQQNILTLLLGYSGVVNWSFMPNMDINFNNLNAPLVSLLESQLIGSEIGYNVGVAKKLKI